jgi:outer membrane biosynthesis protein TonB
MFVCPECGAVQPGPGHCGADGAPVAPIGDDLLLGTTIGAYRVARLLGVGGMGRVYKGVHPQIGSRVAIKVLSRECSDRRDLVDRFFAEAKAVNVIRHESIVNVLDLSTLPDGRPYIVMEYLDGAPLSSLLDQARSAGTRLPLGGLARLVAEVLDALAAAHAKGIIHRDLKPDNIYVTPSGRPKVLDFGIAKLQPELGGSATHTGSLLGTPHYMAPEQAAGRPVDLRADLYAMGVILFECATLQRPFVAEALFDLLRMHVEAPPPSPRALRHDLPESLEHLIFTALAKQPEHRFASAHAMSMALQHATAQLPADQWAPLAPGGGGRSTAGGAWAPTPPASWGGSHARPGGPPSVTATAGQVTGPVPPTGSGSKKAVWIGLASLVLVGGGVTAALVSGDEPAPAPSASEASSLAAAEPVTAPPPPSPAAPPAPTPEPVPAPTPEPAPAPTAEPVPAAAAPVAAAPAAAAPAAAAPAAATPAAKPSRTPSPPPATAPTSTEVAAVVVAGKPAPARPATGTSQALGPDGWVRYTRLPGPAGFDPTKVATAKYLPFALAEARKIAPDAVLFRIDATGVFPDATANFTLVNHGVLDYRFISPSRSTRDPSLPRGAKQPEARCMFRIMIDKDGPLALPMSGWDCHKEKQLGPPRCSFAQVWNKARAKGAPDNALAQLGYRAASGGKPTWYFRIDDDEGKFSVIFPDDC